MMKLIEEFTNFAVYEHHTGKGVIITNAKRGNNGAIFDNLAKAQEKALALLWGGSLVVTHRFKTPVKYEPTTKERNN